MNLGKSNFASLLLVTTFATTIFPTSANPAHAADAITTTTSNESLPVQAQLSALQKALAAGDERAVASFWSDDGLYLDADGKAFRGRAAIERHFAELFKAQGPQFCELVADKLEILNKSSGRADGLVKTKYGVADTRFFMQFDKQDGKWLISTASETQLAGASGNETLNDLSWLVGKWKAERNGGSAEMTAEWIADKHFIRCSFIIQRPGQPVQTDCQIIGRNPERDQLMFWAFLSNGGTGHGSYSHQNGKWLVEATAVEPNGMISKAINIIEPTNPNSFVWQSIYRSVNGIAIADSAPLEVKRVGGNASE